MAEKLSWFDDADGGLISQVLEENPDENPQALQTLGGRITEIHNEQGVQCSQISQLQKDVKTWVVQQ